MMVPIFQHHLIELILKFNLLQKKEQLESKFNILQVYTLIDTWNNKNRNIKEFCTKFCCCFDRQSSVFYINDVMYRNWDKTTYETLYLRDAILDNGFEPYVEMQFQFIDIIQMLI